MEDVAETIIAQLRMDDRPSQFELRAIGADYAHPQYTFHAQRHCDVLKVTAPVEAGRLVFKVGYMDNHDNTGSPPNCVYRNGWQTLTFDKEDWEGAVAFADGFMSDGGRSNRLSLYKEESRRSIAGWDVSVGNGEGKAARIALFRGAFKALLAK